MFWSPATDFRQIWSVCVRKTDFFRPTTAQTENFTCYLAFPESAHQDASNGGLHCSTAPVQEEKQYCGEADHTSSHNHNYIYKLFRIRKICSFQLLLDSKINIFHALFWELAAVAVQYGDKATWPFFSPFSLPTSQFLDFFHSDCCIRSLLPRATPQASILGGCHFWMGQKCPSCLIIWG